MDVSMYKTFDLKFYSPDANTHSVTLKLEKGSQADVEVTENSSVLGWNNLSFDFSSASGRYYRLILFVDGGTAGTGTFYFDDIENGSLDTSNGLDTVYTQLMWADEFDYFGPIKASNWFSETVPQQNGNWFNGEVQHYTDRTENAVAAHGMLTLTAIKETYDFQGNVKGSLAEDIERASMVKLSPNPSNGKFELLLSEDIDPSHIKLISAGGQLVMSRDVRTSEKQIFNLDLEAGVYYFELSNDFGRRWQERRVITD